MVKRCRYTVIDDFTKRDADNDKRAFDLAQHSNEAMNRMASSLEANTKSMDNLIATLSIKH